MTLVPASGRDYQSKAALLADFQADKDFEIADHFDKDDGRKVNCSGLIQAGVRSVNVRYKKLTQVAVIPVK